MKRTTGWMLGTALAAALVAAVPQAKAEEGIYVPLLTYRTGNFAGSGTPIANGMRDYLEMLNQRDGGIGGVKIIIDECETGYDTKKGVECYESTKGKNPVVHNPYSTGLTLQLIPRASVDKIPVLSMAYGLSAAADGRVFPWIFNPPVTYWDGASTFVRFVAAQEGGVEKLKGKTIGLIHLDAPFGREPITVMEELAKRYGFTLKLYPVPAQSMQDQASVWLAIRRDRVDWIYNQGWGAMNPTAVKEAVRTGFPISKLVGVWWAGGDDDARAGGAEAKGYRSLSFHGAGTDYPAMQDILKYVYDRNLASGDRAKVGENLHARGVYNSVLIAEAIRTAQQITGKKVVTGEDVRRGFEALNISEDRWKEIGFAGFAAPVRISCDDHSGHNRLFVAQWDGTRFTRGSDYLEPMKDLVRPMLEQAASDYAEKNSGWPKRTEACDGRS